MATTFDNGTPTNVETISQEPRVFKYSGHETLSVPVYWEEKKKGPESHPGRRTENRKPGEREG